MELFLCFHKTIGWVGRDAELNEKDDILEDIRIRERRYISIVGAKLELARRKDVDWIHFYAPVISKKPRPLVVFFRRLWCVVCAFDGVRPHPKASKVVP
ncbi:hypothetical protein BS47DRAFT_852088 [Hydnum rufescens UP504]|uniref:Uncharacterized protein n=1 Tax=Hydnum rufescens UP504 TaxID=1448309 RepID=A0A9P6B9G6_9AGAM|nr:hypothetical protein BS47DRAFT_852088 [Hydnum rufescens UP504]